MGAKHMLCQAAGTARQLGGRPDGAPDQPRPVAVASLFTSANLAGSSPIGTAMLALAQGRATGPNRAALCAYPDYT